MTTHNTQIRRTGKCRSFALSAAMTLVFASALFVFGGRTDLAAQKVSTSRESRGKQIYTQGTSPSGKEILAYIGESSLEVPGSTVACANCHGLDGKGKPEGDVTPSDLTWEVLTKPYGLRHSDGRQHPPYTQRGLELAITRGVDPGGNKLLNVMPRFVMSRDDLADLVAYIEQLGHDCDPGISDDKIVIATAAPSGGPLSQMGAAVKEVTAAFFDEVNRGGGVYNRRLELKFIETGASGSEARTSFERAISDGKIFAVIAPCIAGAEKEVIPLMSQKQIPLIGPLTLYPQPDAALNRYVFYLQSGVTGQARALLYFVAKKLELADPRVTVVYQKNEINASIVEAMSDEARKTGIRAPRFIAFDGGLDAAEVTRRLKQDGCDVVFCLGSGDEALALMQESEKLDWSPFFCLPVGGGVEVFAAPERFNGRIFFGFPIAPTDQTVEGRRELQSLIEKYNLGTGHLNAQISALGAAKILVDSLRKIGKDLSREKLIQSLESVYEYQTGLTPAISYGPNRRIGARGAYVVKVDLRNRQLVPASGWIDVN